MKIIRIALTAVMLVAAHSAAADQSEGRSVPLYLPGVEVNFPLPDGYCLPQGAYAGYANGTAAADTTNFTDLSYDDCAEMQAGQELRRYGMVKTPRDMVFKLASPELFDQMKQAADNGELKKVLEDPKVTTGAQKDVATATEGRIKVSGLSLQPVDYDDHAVYLAGTLSGETAAGKGASAIAVAMMIVKGRVFLCYFYAPYTGLADIQAVLKSAKAEASRFAQANP